MQLKTSVESKKQIMKISFEIKLMVLSIQKMPTEAAKVLIHHVVF
jgi:hypothetical protein